MPLVLPALRRRVGVLGAGLLCLAVAAAATALYAYLTGPLLQLVLAPSSSSPSAAALPGLGSALGPWSVAGLLVAVALLRGLAELGRAWCLDRTAEQVGHELRARVYRHVLALPLAEHRERARGDVLARLIDDAERVKDATVGAAVALARDGLAALALLAVAILLAPKLALAALVVLPLVGVAVASISRRVRRAAERGQDDLGELAAGLEQSLAAVAELKSAGAEQRVAEQLDQRSERVASWRARRLVVRATLPLLNEVLAAVGLGAALIYAGRLVASGALQSAALVSFFTAVLLLYKPIKGLGNTAQTVAAGRASLARLAELVALTPEVSLSDADVADAPPAREIELCGVSFRYRHGEHDVLRRLDARVSRGEIVAVTGPSGAGKSTLLGLIAGLEVPRAGALRVDGAAPQSLAALRAQIGLVPQQPLLLAGSVADNLRLCAPRASDEQLVAALHAAGLGDLLAAPDGVDALLARRLGPGAQSLSVGQTQRLSLARALLRGASVLALDEPSSALDAEAEGHLVDTLERLRDQHAVVVVSHAPRVIAAADRVLTLNDGELCEVRAPSSSAARAS